MDLVYGELALAGEAVIEAERDFVAWTSVPGADDWWIVDAVCLRVDYELRAGGRARGIVVMPRCVNLSRKPRTVGALP